MNKQQAAENYSHSYDEPYKERAYDDFVAGWEAHEAQCPTKEDRDLYLDYTTRAVGPVERLLEVLELVKDFSQGKYKKTFLSCLFADCEAALDYYYKSESALPQASVGPVWVKANAFKIEFNKLYFLRHVLNRSKKYIGRFVELESMGIVLFLHSESNHGLKIDDVELLDESGTQQVFTREQLVDAYKEGFYDSHAYQLHAEQHPMKECEESCKEYMATNYPPSI